MFVPTSVLAILGLLMLALSVALIAAITAWFSAASEAFELRWHMRIDESSLSPDGDPRR